MAQTITTKKQGIKSQMATGRYLDTGSVAAYTFTLGFRPRYVKVINNTSGDIFEWVEGMAAASATKVTGATGVVTLVTSNGITVSDTGFILGLDTDVNVTSEQVSFVAFG